jgi:acetyltransferase-like isoleucine patch superfamily enzyme
MPVRAEPTAVIVGPVRFEGDAYVGNFTTIAAAQEINIGDRAAIAAGCWIGDHDHDLVGDIGNCGVVEPINIGRRCWIAANVVILKGVTLGDDCVVGAGSVVTRSINEAARNGNVVIMGNPARVVRPKRLEEAA